MEMFGGDFSSKFKRLNKQMMLAYLLVAFLDSLSLSVKPMEERVIALFVFFVNIQDIFCDPARKTETTLNV